MRRLSVAYNISCLIIPSRSVSFSCAINTHVPPALDVHCAAHGVDNATNSHSTRPVASANF